MKNEKNNYFIDIKNVTLVDENLCLIVYDFE